MALFSFNAPKPKRFSYRPLYYSERKERLEKMKAAAESEISGKSCVNLQKGFLSKNRPKPRTLMEKGFYFLRIVTIILLVVLFYILAQEIYLLFHLMMLNR
ncbi:MAG: hypothetical protein LBS09_03385 [Bacteroidales bacterium]|jgi:hypothetical protein|nr:hypothetical protein [Bacteroidales bacterium]